MLESGGENARFGRLMVAVFLCYQAMVMPLPILSVMVARDWGMSNFLAGAAAGSAYFITLFCRKPAGDLADRQGGRKCYLQGCSLYILGGCVCLLAVVDMPVPMRFAVLLIGRMVVGVGESIANIGIVCWSVGLMGDARAGRVMATIGMSMYAAVAFGGQVGFFLFERFGFVGVMLACIASPLIGLTILRSVPEGAPPTGGVTAAKPTFRYVMGKIWRLGLPSCFHAAGFAVLGAFLAKTFLEKGWPYAGLGLTCYGAGFVVMRLFIGHLPDRVGGLPVATGSGLVEIVGLFLLWLAPGPLTALTGSFLTGAGCSMIFPSIAREIMRVMPKSLRGAALSNYNIFQDISYGFAGPAAGLFTDYFGDSFAYLLAALAAVAGFGMLFTQMRQQQREKAS